jgi:predicted enzyme related to lactoylglutathione lyase
MSAAQELRMVITVDDFDKVVRFYRDVVGLDVDEEWEGDGGRGIIFEGGRATLEIFDRKQKESNDVLEAGRVIDGDVRLALKVDDVDSSFHTLVVDGAPLMAHPINAPWGHRIARLTTPHGMQLSLFADI